jgi:hypothetical protein
MILLGLGCRADLRIDTEGYFFRRIVGAEVETSARWCLSLVAVDFDGFPRIVDVE